MRDTSGVDTIIEVLLIGGMLAAVIILLLEVINAII